MKTAIWALLVWIVPALAFAQVGFAQTSAVPKGSAQVHPEANIAQTAPAPNPTQQSKVREAYGKLPLSFERNRGQVDPSVKFLSRGRGYTLFLTGDEAVFSMSGAGRALTTEGTEYHGGKAQNGKILPVSTASVPTGFGKGATPLTDTAVLRMKLHGADASAVVTGEDELPGKSNYFLGNDPKQWHSGVPTYAKVKYEGVYPGVDLVYYGNQRQLEYDFIVAPGADPHRIQFDVRGAKTIKRDRAGDLVLSMTGGEVRWHKPVAYQEDGGKRQEIAAQYVVKGKQVAFEIGAYDRGKKLFIDPLAYSTFLGGSDTDFAMGITRDSSGNVYVVGYTKSTDFPLVNAFQSRKRSGKDAFITKINSSGSALVYSTYLGGGHDDIGNSIAVDSLGNAYVAGSTKSSNFPTANPLQASNAGGMDAFLTKLDSTGASLIYSTYLGGSLDDAALGVATDFLGNTFAVGYTSSTNFPIVNAVQPTNAGAKDAFLVKLDPTGSSFFYSTYLGGNGADSGAAIAIDSSGKAYVTGSTSSTNFPIANAFQPTYGGDQDAFVSVVGTLDGTLVYSTYLGGSGADQGNAIALDSSQNAYVTGYTSSADFTTTGAVQPTFGGVEDAFVTELSKSGSVLFSTYLGGSNSDIGSAIALDPSGDIYVTGNTSSTDFPTVLPFQAKKADQSDAFITQLTPNGAAYVYSTYLGGVGSDFGQGIVADASGDAFVAGYTGSTNFPSLNAIQASYGGGNDEHLCRNFCHRNLLSH
jgi:Beta-propeller repeat